MEKTPFAFFDVDGTVIRTDSFRLLVKTAFLKAPWRLVFLPVCGVVALLTWFLKLDRRYAKSCTLWAITVGKSKRDAVRLLKSTLSTRFQDLWFVQMKAELEELRAKGFKICYVSASGQIWIRSLLNAMDQGEKRVIGSRLGFFFGGVIMTSRNCYGVEKLSRIDALLGKDIHWKIAYSDHIADLPLLLACENKVVISPKTAHLNVFKAKFKNNFTLNNW